MPQAGALVRGAEPSKNLLLEKGGALLRQKGGGFRQYCFFLKLKAMLPEIYAGCAERGNPDMAIFHYTIKIVGRSKGKSVISASAYLNGDVMKNEETGRISYYTSKKKWSTPV